ncbi:related to aminotriazole resistance protein [Pseudozyma flocculosa]|nr:related to aminotriazole resistance protein [Pseudozyma flocculosa]
MPADDTDCSTPSGAIATTGPAPPSHELPGSTPKQGQPAPTSIFHGSAGAVRQAVCSVSLCMVMLLTQAALGATIFGGSYIADTFGLADDPEQQSWFAAAFSLTVGTFVLPAGRLGDLYGNRIMVLVGYAWVGAWSLVAGLSHYTRSAIFFDVCRGLQGLGFAVLLPNSLAVLARIFPPQSRAKRLTFCLYAATAPSGAVLGGTFTCLLGATVGWWWGFYLLAIVCAALVVICTAVVPSDRQLHDLGRAFLAQDDEKHQHDAAFKDEEVADVDEARSISPSHQDQPGQRAAHRPLWERLDLLGMVLGVSGLVLFNFAWNQALLVGWSTVYVYVLLIVGVMLLCAFVVWESRASLPLLPTSIFNLQGCLILGALALGWSAFSIWLFYITQFVIRQRGYSPLGSVAALSPAAIAGVVAAFSSERILARFGSKVVMLLALIAFTTGISIAGTAPVEQTYWAQTFVASFVMPFGMDMSFPSASIILSDMLPHHRQGEASSLVNTVVNYSVALGLGIAGTVESQVNRQGTDELRGYRGAFYLGIGLGALGVLMSVINLAISTQRRSA